MQVNTQLVPAVTPTPEQIQPSALQNHRSAKKVLETELGIHLVQQTPLFYLQTHICAALLIKAWRNSTMHRPTAPAAGWSFPWETQHNY